MSKPWLIVICVLIFVVLISVFIVSFILYRKTPVPKDCIPTEEQCKGCNMKGCRANIYAKREEKEGEEK